MYRLRVNFLILILFFLYFFIIINLIFMSFKKPVFDNYYENKLVPLCFIEIDGRFFLISYSAEIIRIFDIYIPGIPLIQKRDFSEENLKKLSQIPQDIRSYINFVDFSKKLVYMNGGYVLHYSIWKDLLLALRKFINNMWKLEPGNYRVLSGGKFINIK